MLIGLTWLYLPTLLQSITDFLLRHMTELTSQKMNESFCGMDLNSFFANKLGAVLTVSTIDLCQSWKLANLDSRYVPFSMSEMNWFALLVLSITVLLNEVLFISGLISEICTTSYLNSASSLIFFFSSLYLLNIFLKDERRLNLHPLRQNVLIR